MKKLTTNSKLIGCLMGLSIVALGTGCTDSDYDLSSVDSAHPINQGENSLILYKICTFVP